MQYDITKYRNISDSMVLLVANIDSKSGINVIIKHLAVQYHRNSSISNIIALVAV